MSESLKPSIDAITGNFILLFLGTFNQILHGLFLESVMFDKIILPKAPFGLGGAFFGICWLTKNSCKFLTEY